MLAEFSSPPPEAPSPQPILNHPANKKRKRGVQQPATSPAPSDPGTPEVLTSRTDLFSRPQLTVSRGPIFVPIADGSNYFKTELIGVNRVGFRYMPAGLKPSGSTIHFRTIESNPRSYRASWEDRSPFVHVTKDGLGLLGTKGYRSARCNAPVREGKWYMEVKILHGGGDSSSDGRRDGCHVRVGWGRREAPLNGPVGLDGYSYGYRDKTGDKVTLSRPRPYGRPFSSGDVVGMYISLPPRRIPNPKDPYDPAHLNRERIAIDFKGQEMFEMQEYPQSKEMIALMDYSGKTPNTSSVPSSSKKGGAKLPERSGGPTNVVNDKNANLRPLPVLPQSRISFFVNGECQGVAFQDIYDYLQLRTTDRKAKEKKRYREGFKESHKDNPFDDGTLGYYPFISLFNDASVQINAGPDFEYPPPPDIDAILDDPSSIVSEEQARTWQPICERYPQFMAEQWEFDEREEQEAEVNLAQLAAQDKAAAEKKAQRTKKRQQADARKKAKTVIKDKSPSVGNDERPISSMSYAAMQPQPSPLRHASTVADVAEDSADSPAPTLGNYGDTPGGRSGYTSENGEEEVGEESAFYHPSSDNTLWAQGKDAPYADDFYQ